MPRQPLSSELSRDAVKAGFLFNFAQYASWPAGGASGDRVASPGVLTLCLENGVLDNSVFVGWGAATGGDRRLQLTSVERDAVDLTMCDMLFTGAPNAVETAPSLLATANRENILLVSEAPGFARSGGHIELFLENNQFRFRINLNGLKRSGIELSSKVLRLAEIVESTAWRTSP